MLINVARVQFKERNVTRRKKGWIVRDERGPRGLGAGHTSLRSVQEGSRQVGNLVVSRPGECNFRLRYRMAYPSAMAK